MKVSLKSYATVIGIVILLTTISINAQSRGTMKITIPFEFIVAGNTFKAGDYTIKRFNPQNRSILILKAIKGDSKKIFLTHKIISKKSVETPKIVFTKIGSSHFLSQIWSDSTGIGFQVFKGKQERKMERLGEFNREEVMIARKD